MNSTYTVDRIEGDIMVVINQDTNETIDVPHALAPSLTEGDVFTIQSDSTIKNDQLSEAEARLKRLKEKSPQPTLGSSFDL
jgi:hypothetical protein